VVAVVGTWVWGYGVPRMPPGIRQSGRPINPDNPGSHGASHVLTHDHVLAFSHVDEEKMAALAPHLELLATFDPFAAGRRDAIFEPSDAYYIPFHRFDAVVRPGPLIRIYALHVPGAAP